MELTEVEKEVLDDELGYLIESKQVQLNERVYSDDPVKCEKEQTYIEILQGIRNKIGL